MGRWHSRGPATRGPSMSSPRSAARRSCTSGLPSSRRSARRWSAHGPSTGLRLTTFPRARWRRFSRSIPLLRSSTGTARASRMSSCRRSGFSTRSWCRQSPSTMTRGSTTCGSRRAPATTTGSARFTSGPLPTCLQARRSGSGSATSTCGSTTHCSRSSRWGTKAARARCTAPASSSSPTRPSPSARSGSWLRSSRSGASDWMPPARSSGRRWGCAPRRSCSAPTLTSSCSWATSTAAGRCTTSIWNGTPPPAPPGASLPSSRPPLGSRSGRAASSSWPSRSLCSTCRR
mmetsp:Transcript_5388/g.15007  ORF Transcript_5388/g.15007 Transcript_5388/m.15007 type:complete len:289 (-) Transcript_5388:202-1068(-)